MAQLKSENCNTKSFISNIFQKIGNNFLKGKLTSSSYDKDLQTIRVRGYVYPMSNYDRIDLEINGKTYRVNQNLKSLEANKQFPFLNSIYSGFLGVVSNIELSEGKNNYAKINVYRNDKVVFSLERKIKFEKIKLELSYNKYQIYAYELQNAQGLSIKRISAFNEIITRMIDWMPWEEEKYFFRFCELKNEIIYGSESVETLFVKIFSDGNIINLKGGKLEYVTEHSIWVIMNELLGNQEYWFETEKKAPVIIDGGANIGLAVYYFKTRFPDSQIMAFEPSTEMFEILSRNIKRNNWQGVKAFQFAIDEKERDMELLIPSTDCLGASLTTRPQETTNKETKFIKQTVHCIDLNNYIGEAGIDFLKLDIEGVEGRVLRSLKGNLAKIEKIFCEYHFGESLKDNSFAELISLFENNGFNIQVAKSPSYQRLTGVKTMSYVGKRYSLNVWARKK